MSSDDVSEGISEPRTALCLLCETEQNSGSAADYNKRALHGRDGNKVYFCAGCVEDETKIAQIIEKIILPLKQAITVKNTEIRLLQEQIASVTKKAAKAEAKAPKRNRNRNRNRKRKGNDRRGKEPASEAESVSDAESVSEAEPVFGAEPEPEPEPEPARREYHLESEPVRRQYRQVRQLAAPPKSVDQRL